MTTNKQRLIDLLAMGRVANLPTVVSNVLVGCLLGLIFQNNWQGLHPLIAPCIAGCLLYLGGCFLNDWKDSQWDAKHKPDRPIPSHRWSQRSILTLSFLLILTGLLVAIKINTSSLVVAFLITIAICIYTHIHKKTAWSIIPMGACRALLYYLGFFSQTDMTRMMAEFSFGFSAYSHDSYYLTLHLASFVIFAIPSLGILSYIAGLSLLARFEAKGSLSRSNKVVALFLLFLPALTHSFIGALRVPIISLLATIPFIICVIASARLIKKSVAQGVSLLLASITSLDLIIFIPLAYSDEFSRIHFSSSTTLNQLLIFPAAAVIAFFLSLLLQRIAPAT